MTKIARIKNYKPTIPAKEMHSSTEKMTIVIAAIRSGKSFSLIYDVIEKAYNNETPYGILVVAPTYKLLREVIETPIVEIFTGYDLLKRHSYNEGKITLSNNNVIYFRSAENYDISIRGLNVCRAYVDEATYISPEAFDVILGRLVLTDGQLVMTGTPNGKNNFIYEKFFAAGRLPNTKYITYRIFDNPIITKEAVEFLKSIYDPLKYRQEVLGEFVNLYENSVYHSFSEDNVGDYPYDPNLPVYVGIDFNIGINAWVALQRRKNNSYVCIREGSGTKITADMAKQILENFHSPLIIPDATGGNRLQGIGFTQFDLLRQAGLHNIHEQRKNPNRLERYDMVNAALLNALGERRLLFDRTNCPTIIKELQILTYREGSNEIDSRAETIGHISDALGYAVNYLTDGTVGALTRNTSFVDEMRLRASYMNETNFLENRI